LEKNLIKRRKVVRLISSGLLGTVGFSVAALAQGLNRDRNTLISLTPPANPPINIDTIAQLRNRTAATQAEQINLAGYYAKGDGGSGLFYADLKDTKTPDDGGTVIAPKSGGARWKRMNTSKHNVKWFGARGNGKSNDTEAIARAVKASQNKTLEFPAGKYIGQLVINISGIKVVGIGDVAIGGIIGEALTVSPAIGATNVAPFLGWSDKSDVKGLKRLVLASDAAVGTSVLKLKDAAGVNAGDWVILVQGKAEATNPTNHIPLDYQFLKIAAKDGNNLTIQGKTDTTYRANQPYTRLLKWGQLVVNSSVENITFRNLNGGAYLHSIGGSVNFLVKNCSFAGFTAMGVSCFNLNLTYQDCQGYDLYSGLSCARCTESVVYENCAIAIRAEKPTEYIAGYFEESAKSIKLNNCKFSNGVIYCIQLQRPKSEFLLTNTTITNKFGAGVQFQFCYGDNILIDNCQITARGKDLPKLEKAVIGQRYGSVVKVKNSKVTALDENSYPHAYDQSTATGIILTNVKTNRTVPLKVNN